VGNFKPVLWGFLHRPRQGMILYNATWWIGLDRRVGWRAQERRFGSAPLLSDLRGGKRDVLVSLG